jgi:hypothetical protein
MAQTKTKQANKPKRSSSSKVEPAKAKSTRKTTGVSSRAVQLPRAARDAGQATGQALRKARVPLLAGGAAVAGTVGGVVLGASRSGGKVLGVKLPEPKRVNIRSKDLVKAAKEVGRFGESVGDLTEELKKAREGLAGANGKHDSPVEVLLRGLTHRR